MSSPSEGAEGAWATLLEHADLACYDAKGRGGHQVRPFRSDGTAIVRISKARRLAAAAEEAVDNGKLRLAARPIVPLQDANSLAHCELLARLPRAEAEYFEAADLARIARQEPALVQRIDRWAISTAFKWIAKNHRSNERTARWFINLSAGSLEDPTLIAYIDEQLRASKVPAARIGFEIDESALNEHFAAASALLPKLRKLGFESTLDGFGRGVSSFAYLKALDVSYVKIDWAALQGQEAAPSTKARAAGNPSNGSLELLGSLHQINRTLGRRTIVQSLHEPDQAPAIVKLGIDYAQGSAVSTLTASLATARATRSG